MSKEEWPLHHHPCVCFVCESGLFVEVRNMRGLTGFLHGPRFPPYGDVCVLCDFTRRLVRSVHINIIIIMLLKCPK